VGQAGLGGNGGRESGSYDGKTSRCIGSLVAIRGPELSGWSTEPDLAPQKCSEFLPAFDNFTIVRIHRMHMVLTLSPP
jgi:hypothetical protein